MTAEFKKCWMLKIYTGEDVPVSLFTGVSNLPVLVTIVDQKENLEKLIPFLEKKATHALVLFEESTALVTDYMRQVIAKRQADGLEK